VCERDFPILSKSRAVATSPPYYDGGWGIGLGLGCAAAGRDWGLSCQPPFVLLMLTHFWADSLNAHIAVFASGGGGTTVGGCE